MLLQARIGDRLASRTHRQTALQAARPVVGLGSRRSTVQVANAVMLDFNTKYFKKEHVRFAETEEYIIRGGRDKFPGVKQAFAGVKKIGVIGWGSQAPAQAQNLKDTFKDAGIDTKVAIGLRSDSPSWKEAEACGFSKAAGTLGEVFDVIKDSDMVILLISDAAQVGPSSLCLACDDACILYQASACDDACMA